MIRSHDPFAEKSVKAKANDTEKRLSKQYGAKKHPASGALAGFKGDFSDKAFLYDAKEDQKGKGRITVRVEDLMKISREANAQSRHPALVLVFGKTSWVLLPQDVHNEMKVMK